MLNAKDRELLSHNSLYCKQLWDWRKVTIAFDIYGAKEDIGAPEKVLMQCREANVSKGGELLRFLTNREKGPCDVTITGPDRQQLVRIRKGISITSHKYDIFDGEGRLLGYFQRETPFLRWDRPLEFFTRSGVMQYQLHEVEGKRATYEFVEGENVHATVRKDWGKGVKEKVMQVLSTTHGDDYVVDISKRLPEGSSVRLLILASVIVYDYSYYSAK